MDEIARDAVQIGKQTRVVRIIRYKYGISGIITGIHMCKCLIQLRLNFAGP